MAKAAKTLSKRRGIRRTPESLKRILDEDVTMDLSDVPYCPPPFDLAEGVVVHEQRMGPDVEIRVGEDK